MVTAELGNDPSVAPAAPPAPDPGAPEAQAGGAPQALGAPEAGVSEADRAVLREAGIGRSLLADLPDWAVRYAAMLVSVQTSE